MGYIVIILVIVETLVRLIISSTIHAPIFEWALIPIWEKWIIGVTISFFCIWFWNKFIRRRCSKCKSTNYEFLGEKEIDRWLGTKQVTENLASGKKETRTVQTTFVKIERFYKCKNCGYNWSEVSKEEKK